MAKDVSEVEDGFALKRRRDKASKARTKRKRRELDTGHTIPPPPVKHILSSYTMSNPASKRAVSDYAEIQAREKVEHAERLMTEHVLGRDYDCWDVHTDKDRYWIITNPTNLYSQHFFPSLDFTLSFHIGVTTRVMALQRGAPNPSHKSRFTPVWRRWEQAAETYDGAEEAEDFQAVGMKCRETLIQYVRALAKSEMVPAGQEAPKRADVVGWSSLIANAIAAGDRNSYVRGHLKAISKSAWDLSNWLTHQNGATRHDAEIVLDAVHSVIDTFGTAVIRHESGAPDQCPQCGSYALDIGFEPELMPRPYILECENCGWQRQPEEEA